MRRFATFELALLVGLAACQGYTPPLPPGPRQPTTVSASAGKTWDAVIELFAERSIPIRTIERASGFIATEELLVDDANRLFADCGSYGGATMVPTPTADKAIYNVLVRGDSVSSTVRVTPRFASTRSSVATCVTTGRWEEEMEADVKAVAEGRPVAPHLAGTQSAPSCIGDAATRDGDDWRVTVYEAKTGQPCATPRQCKYREGALNMSRETAIQRCVAEKKREP